MWLIYVIDIVAVAVLVAIAARRGAEQVLPVAAFILVLVPRDAALQLPGLFDLTTQRVVLVALIGLYFVFPAKDPRSGRFDTPLKWLIITHIVWCLISTANSIVPLMSLKKMVSEVFEYYLMYYIFFRTIRDVRTINRILFAIVSAIIVSSVFGAIEAYGEWSVMKWFPAVVHRFEGWSAIGTLSGRDVRVVSTFAHPILFGAGLTMAIVLALYLLKTTNDSRKKIFLWGGLLLMFLNIYKTSSRGPWLGLIVSLSLLLLFDKGRVRKYLTVIGVIILAVFVIRPGVLDTIVNIYYATFDLSSPLGTSYEYRYALRDLAVKTVSKDMTRELWGYGMESFYYLGLEGELNGRPYRFLSCDSSWLEVMVETGYGGLLIIASILFTPAWRAWRHFRHSSDRHRHANLYFLVNMVAYYFMMLSVAMYSWGQTGYMLWIIIAASLAYSRLEKAQAHAAKVLKRIDNSMSLTLVTTPSMDQGC